jgi:hypothetical protein
MTTPSDSLVAAVADLEQALTSRGAGSEADQDRRLEQALAAHERAVREHSRALGSDDGRVVDIESPRLPSPTVARQMGVLHRELDQLLREISTLRDKLSRAMAPSDVGPLHTQVRRLVESLGRYNEDEARVIQDSVNTDIGAGD